LPLKGCDKNNAHVSIAIKLKSNTMKNNNGVCNVFFCFNNILNKQLLRAVIYKLCKQRLPCLALCCYWMSHPT